MLVLEIVMIMIYIYVYFKCYVQFNRFVSKQEWPKAGTMLGTIRELVAANLSIGIITILAATRGRYL